MFFEKLGKHPLRKKIIKKVPNYAFKFANNHGNGVYFGLRHVELQTEDDVSNIKKFMGIPYTSIKKANTVSIADIKKISGIQ